MTQCEAHPYMVPDNGAQQERGIYGVIAVIAHEVLDD